MRCGTTGRRRVASRGAVRAPAPSACGERAVAVSLALEVPQVSVMRPRRVMVDGYHTLRAGCVGNSGKVGGRGCLDRPRGLGAVTFLEVAAFESGGGWCWASPRQGWVPGQGDAWRVRKLQHRSRPWLGNTRRECSAFVLATSLPQPPILRESLPHDERGIGASGNGPEFAGCRPLLAGSPEDRRVTVRMEVPPGAYGPTACSCRTRASSTSVG